MTYPSVFIGKFAVRCIYEHLWHHSVQVINGELAPTFVYHSVVCHRTTTAKQIVKVLVWWQAFTHPLRYFRFAAFVWYAIFAHVTCEI